MADLKSAKDFIEKNIVQLEKQLYLHQTVAMARYEADRKILAEMKTQLLRLDAIEQKQERGEEISMEEIYASVPEIFR